MIGVVYLGKLVNLFFKYVKIHKTRNKFLDYTFLNYDDTIFGSMATK